MFLSSFEHTVDKKGRIAIPAKWRSELGEKYYLSIPIDGQPCLTLYTQASWDALMAKIETLPMIDKLKMKRYIGFMACDVTCDAQGRILIPQNMRNYASITENAFVNGASDTIEIWNKENWQAQMASITPEGFFNIIKDLEI